MLYLPYGRTLLSGMRREIFGEERQAILLRRLPQLVSQCHFASVEGILLQDQLNPAQEPRNPVREPPVGQAEDRQAGTGR